jgi:hypothetical protein
MLAGHGRQTGRAELLRKSRQAGKGRQGRQAGQGRQAKKGNQEGRLSCRAA